MRGPNGIEVESDLAQEEFDAEYEKNEDSDFTEDDLDLGLIGCIDVVNLSNNVWEMEMDEEGM
ncbi:hypothetical protein BT96DRAFT_996643 [Gymnopus androsaceus JB14]|uniref:Uncharacterized protein n=1 Tax=Gymnopus androsaceus JB14 TaxID=1447944 RepID=A0A6A4HFP1_9AGAR|nr:hypothetical protein BT96DRAFT_996643 [Gymnopus androsaceus JB14]